MSGTTPPPGEFNTPYPAPDNRPQQDAKGFFGALFDLSFATFITPKVVKVAYALAIAIIGIALAFWLVRALVAGEIGFFLLVLILGPVAALFYLILIRMSLEFFVALIRMSEDVHRRLPGS